MYQIWAFTLWTCLIIGITAAQNIKGFEIDHPDDDAPGREDGNLLEAVDDKGLHTYTKLNGSVTNLDHIFDTIKLNRTTAYLNCSQGFMQVDLKFMEPFHGIAYADYDRNSACITKGRGLSTARIEMPLKGCGTKQGPSRVFTNNIVVRFHPFLEMDGDEVITIICRYPPAVAPIPKGPPVAGPILAEPGPFFTPLFIVLMVCTLLFLALTLAGLGCSYLCLRGRPVTIVRKAYTGSDITKLSGSSILSRPSMFDDFKIPRIMSTQQGYGSEAHLVIDQSDTLPSDYPSESHSEVDEERSLPVSSAGSYETKAFINQQVEQRASSSLYSETINEVESTAILASRITQSRHPMTVPTESKFDVQMRIKNIAAPPSPLPSESDSSLALERNLTTILEREERIRSSIESPPPRLTTFSYVPELHVPPSCSRQQTPPVYSRILRKQAERSEVITETVGLPSLPRPRSIASLNTELTETRSLTEVTDASHAKFRVASMLAPNSPLPQPPTMSSHMTEEYNELVREHVEPLEEPVVAARRPEITTHEVDDVFLRTITEKKTIEDIERHRRQTLEYQARQKPQPDPKWDVTIRNYPTDELTPPGPPEWENFSDVSSASNLTVTLEPAPSIVPKSEEPFIDIPVQPTYTTRADIPTRRSSSRVSDEQEHSTETITWCNLERVLEIQYASEFTEEERTKWRKIITTESTLRTLLTEALVKEDYELIRKDSRYFNLFSPDKWDVIIRILSPPGNGSISSSSHGKSSGQRYKRTKSSEWDNRSRRSSLPTLYEYESDGGSLVPDQFQSAAGPASGMRIRKLSSTTRSGSEVDLRSMSEMTVRDFARLERDEITSLSSFEGESLVRSLSQPSLARSGSEFTEHWGLPARNLPQWDMDDGACTSADTTPQPTRRGLTSSEEVSNSSHQESSTITANASSSFSRSTRYSKLQFQPSSQEQQQQQQQQKQRGSWTFHDDSEPEMQI